MPKYASEPSSLIKAEAVAGFVREGSQEGLHMPAVAGALLLVVVIGQSSHFMEEKDKNDHFCGSSWPLATHTRSPCRCLGRLWSQDRMVLGAWSSQGACSALRRLPE